MQMATTYSCAFKLLLESAIKLFPRVKCLLLQIIHGADLFNRLGMSSLLFHKALKIALLNLYPIYFFLRLIFLTSQV